MSIAWDPQATEAVFPFFPAFHPDCQAYFACPADSNRAAVGLVAVLSVDLQWDEKCTGLGLCVAMSDLIRDGLSSFSF